MIAATLVLLAQTWRSPTPRVPTRTPVPVATATPGPQVTPPPTPSPWPTPTRTPPAASSDCVTPWPTTTPGRSILLNYRGGGCFDNVLSDTLGPEADVFLRVDDGAWRQLRWVAVGCWVYASDGTVPYARPAPGRSTDFHFEIRKGGVTNRAGVRFFGPSYLPE